MLTYIRSVVENLEALGHRVDVYARWTGTTAVGQAVRLVEGKRIPFLLRSFRELLRHDYDGLICNDASPPVMACIAYSLLRPVRVVCIFHNFVDERRNRGIQRMFFKTLFALQDRNRVHCVFVSNQLQKHFADKLGFKSANQSPVVRAGAPPEVSLNRDPEAVRGFRRRFGVGDNECLVLGLSLTISKEKAEGAAVLIRALPTILESHPSVKIMLTRGGKGHFVGWLNRLGEQFDVSGHVVFTGELEDPILAIKACDIYAHVVMDEGLPIALLEAMAAGKPIVASRRAGIPEAITDQVEGLLVEPKVDEVAFSIMRMIDDPELRQRLSTAAKVRARSMNWRATTQRYLELLSGGP